MLRTIRYAIMILVSVIVVGGGSMLYLRHSLTAELDATVMRIANTYTTVTAAHAPPLLSHSDITGQQLGLLHALIATAEYLEKAATTEERVRVILDYQSQSQAFVASVTSEQVAMLTNEHFLPLGRETGKYSSARKDIDQYNNLLLRLQGEEGGAQASLLPVRGTYHTLPFLRFDGPAPVKVEVSI